MINIPIFESLDIDGYGLFPNRESPQPGLHVKFQPGLTLVVGANGLGKTTLITMMFRMLTGTFDIPGLTGSGALGTTRLTPSMLQYGARTMFAQRVNDSARNAIARLRFRLGDDSVTVERRLSNLQLAAFKIADKELPVDEQHTFQTEIARLAGVWSFGDWILLLRHLVFYFEDRRALVWDPSAQRQVLRMLLLPADTAQKWTQDEREILELDSQARNLSATLFSQERALANAELRVSSGEGVKARLTALEQLQELDVNALQDLDSELLDLDEQRQNARLSVLKLEQERESAYRELEHAKLIAIEARFPERSATARYIMAQILTEQHCLVCGSDVPKTAAELEERISAEQCVICGTTLDSQDGHVSPAKVSDRRVNRVLEDLDLLEAGLAEARRHLQEVSELHSQRVTRVAELNKDVATRSSEIDSLVKRLPPEEAEIHEQRNELALLRSRLESLKNNFETKRQEFGRFVENTSLSIVQRSGDIQEAFGHHAEEFLIEDCSLVWSPQRARVGQSGDPIQFPAFEFEMSGASFPSPVRRSGPEQVSESQREFIDLAFRMALMQVAGSDGLGSLVIDAPESSLDAVFSARAANVLARYARPDRGNRLVVTSNLVEGHLIPSLLAQATAGESAAFRLIDLFAIAEPTAAVREHKTEYEAILARMLREVNETGSDSPNRGTERAT